MRKRFTRLSLLWKILLSTSVAVTAIFFITGQIVLGNINRTLWDTLEEEVQNGFQAYTSLLQSRAELLASASRLKICEDTPGWSGRPNRVILASSRL